jgi:hypothetical protein
MYWYLKDHPVPLWQAIVALVVVVVIYWLVMKLTRRD